MDLRYYRVCRNSFETIEFDIIKKGQYITTCAIYDEDLSEINYQDFLAVFTADFTKRYKSFAPCNRWIDREKRAILKNDLFYIALGDNEWSIAVMLLQKEQYSLKGLQAKHYKGYLEGIKECLFNQFDTLGIYAGPWTSGQIKRPESA